MKPQEILAKLDACRPDGEETTWPEVAEAAARAEQDDQLQQAWQRMRSIDLNVQQAVSDVEVPQGLADQILLALEQDRAASSPSPESPRSRFDWLRSRRGVLQMSLLSLAALVFLGIGYQLWFVGPGLNPTRENLIEQARLDYDLLAGQPKSNWQPIEDFPDQLPPSPQVQFLRGWQQVNFFGHSAAAYRLGRLQPNEPDGILFVANIPETDHLQTLTVRLSNTGPYWSAAWQEQEHTYVLVIRAEPGQIDETGRPFLSDGGGIALLPRSTLPR